MPRAFPRALPHGPLVEVLPDLFVVTGTFRMALGAIAFPRNMAIQTLGDHLKTGHQRSGQNRPSAERTRQIGV